MFNKSMPSCNFLVILFCLINLKRLSCSHFVFEISNGTIDKEYTSLISQTSIHVYVFSFPVKSYRIETSLNSSDVASPVLIYVDHQTYEESWSLPIDHQLLSSARSACSAPLVNVTKTLTIKVQTFSAKLIQYSLKVARIVSNVIQLGQQVSALFNHAFPTYFVMDIPVDLEVIDVTLSSLSELCSLVRVTNYLCPPDFTIRSSRSNTGYDFTMTEAANLRVERSAFAAGRLMVLLIPLPASECETSFEYSTNASSEYYAKNTSLKITAGNTNFLGPILIFTAIYLAPFVMFAIIIGLELLMIHYFPQLSRYFSIFSRVRRVPTQNSDVSYKQVKGPDKNEDVELDVATVLAEAPSTDENKTTEFAENASETALECYKRELTYAVVSSHVRGTYYFEIVNNNEIKVKDLNLKTDREVNQAGMLYFYLVIIVGIFYMIPAVQVSYSRLIQMEATGDQDICYNNFKCERDYLFIRGFNHLWSNISYMLVGFLALIITAVKNISFVRELRAEGLSTTGVPQIFGLYYGVSVALFFVGIMSGIYHMCPSILNFQFDTTFMYILLALVFIRLYNNRHPDSEVKPCLAFILLSIIVLFTCISLFKEGSTTNYTGKIILTIGLTVYTLITVYMVYNLFIGELAYFYCKDLRQHKSILRILRQLFWPKYNKSRIFSSVIIIIPLICIIALLWIGYFNSVASSVVYYFGFELIMYINYYWVLKFINKEFLHRPVVFFFAFSLWLLSFVLWIPAVYFYSGSSSHWEDSPAVARTFNTDCIFLDFYDNHDVWHGLSAFALLTIYLSTLLIDDNLYFVQRDKICVF